MDLFYPEMLLQLGAYNFTKGIRIKVYSSVDSYFDWAKVTFTKQFTDNIKLSKLDIASIYLGYGGSYNKVFDGFIAHDFALSENINEVLLKDIILRLEAKVISNVFLDCQPSEVISYCCEQAGIKETKISKVQYYQKNYTVFSESALKAIQGINSNWGIYPKFFAQDGVFYWDTPPEQKQIYEFIEAKNIISLAKNSGYWVIETVAVPFIKHSHKISVKHPLVSGQFKVQKIIFESNDAGFLRSRIYFKE